MFVLIEKTINRLARAVALVGGAGLLVAILVTCLSIIGKLCRRGLNTVMGEDFNPPYLAWVRPILGEEELVQYAVGFALFAALPWATLQQAHIVINLLEKFFSRAVNRVLDLLGNIAFAVIVYLIMSQQWFLIFKKSRAHQDSLSALLLDGNWTAIVARLRVYDESQILGIKLLPLYAIAEFFIILLFVVSLFCVVRSVRQLTAGTPDVK